MERDTDGRKNSVWEEDLGWKDGERHLDSTRHSLFHRIAALRLRFKNKIKIILQNTNGF